MSFSLEQAFMMQALLDMSPSSGMVPTLKAIRDNALARVPEELEREWKALDTLMSGATVVAMDIPIPVQTQQQPAETPPPEADGAWWRVPCGTCARHNPDDRLTCLFCGESLAPMPSHLEDLIARYREGHVNGEGERCGVFVNGRGNRRDTRCETCRAADLLAVKESDGPVDTATGS